jgi:hypothetical protein
MRNIDTLTPTGYLQIYKVYSDGTRELHWEDNNVITSGMGVGLGALYTGSYHAGASILNYQIRYFQLGISGTSNYGVSTNQLASALSDFTVLSGASVILTQHTQYINGNYIPSTTFFTINQSNIYRVSPTSVRYHLIIPADSLNDLTTPINEVGLFMKNPFNTSPHSSILVAYKYFSSILKTQEFALLFSWQINF